MDCIIRGTIIVLIIFASLALIAGTLAFITWGFNENPNIYYLVIRSAIVAWVLVVSVTCAEKRGWFK